MSELNNDIKQKLSSMTCKIHNKAAEVNIVNDNIEFTACCNEFGEECKTAMEEAVHQSMVKQIQKIFKK